MLGQDGWYPADNVLFLNNPPFPKIYALSLLDALSTFRESGCLYQPTYLGPRSDIAVEECMGSQLKVKTAGSEVILSAVLRFISSIKSTIKASSSKWQNDMRTRSREVAATSCSIANVI